MAEQQRSLAVWLALVDRLIEERFSAALEEHGVTRAQWRVLGVLSGGEARPEELEAALAEVPTGADGASAPEQLRELVESGWITEGEAYAITERGAAAHGRLDAFVAQLRATLTTGISPEEQDATSGVLERMARNLGWDG